MTRLNLIARVERLERLEVLMGKRLDLIQNLVSRILHRLANDRPAAPTLLAAFHPTGDSMNALLIATLPTTRKDGSPLAATDIASITFQKAPNTAPAGQPVVPGPEVVLATHPATPGAGLVPNDLTFTDTSAAPEDTYTCFVTDTLGDVGDLSNADVAPAKLAPPGAPSLAATFT